MSADLERLLHDTAVEPEQHPDPGALVARGRRRRRTRRAAAGAGAALAVLAAGVLVPGVLPDDRPVIVDRPSPDPRPSPTATAPQSDVRPVAGEVADRAAGAAAVAEGFGSVWFAGPSRDDEARETADVVRVSPDGSRLEAVVTVPVPMSHLAVTGDAVWGVRTGDGAVPLNVLVRIDPATNEVVDEVDLGAFSTAGMVATAAGDVLLVSGNGHPAEAMWVSGDTAEITGRTGIDVLGSAHAVAYRDGTVAVADFDTSSVLVVAERDLWDGVLPERVGLPYRPTHVTFSADGGLWVASIPESTVTVVEPGAWSVGETYFLPGSPVSASAAADGDAVVVTFDGTVVRQRVDGRPAVVSEAPFDTRVAPVAAGRVWIVAVSPAEGIASVVLGPAPSANAVPLERDDRPSATPSSSDTPAEADPRAGQTFVLLRGVDPTAGTVTVDEAEWLSGEEARAAHEEETGEPDGPPNDYYIRNTDTTEKTYPVAADAVIIHRVPRTIETAQGDLEDLHASWASMPDHAPYWIGITDGVVTRIEWQYTP